MERPDPCHRVLLVDDDPDISRLIARRLAWARKPGFVVEHAADLQSALARMEHGHYDALVLDLGLPDGDTTSTLAAAAAFTRHLPVVVLTAADDDELALLAARVGIQDYQVKGKLDATLVARTVLAAIHRHRWSRRVAGLSH